MRKITLMIIVSLLSFCTYGQLALEGFESAWTGTPAAPPGGWVVYNQEGVATTWIRSVEGNTSTPPFAGVHAAYLNKENVAPSAPIPTDWLITPQFNGPNNGQLHFYSRLTVPGDQGGIYKIKIAVADALTPVTDLPWVDLVTPMTELILNPIQSEYVEKTINIPAIYTGQQIRIAFVMEGDDKDRWLIDNVEAISQCSAPSTLTAADITLTTAKLGWTSPTGVTAWEIEVLPDAGVPTGVGVPYSGTLPYQATGLTANTDYKFYVRSACSDGGKSVWVGPFYFITPAIGEKCADPLVIPNTQPLPYTTTNNTTNFGDNYEGIPGTGCGATGNYLAGNDVIYSYTPTTSGTINVSLSGTGGNAGLFVYSSCASIGVSCLAGVTASATAAGVIPALVVTANTTYYIVISTNGTPQVTQYTLTLQQVYCAAPTGLTASGQTSTSANLSWALGTATAWQIAVQTAGTGLPTGAGQNVTQNSLTATTTSAGVPFTQATAYEYYVRANCGDGTYSIWTGPFAFSTTQVPAAMNYAESFDGPLAHGWSLNNGAQTNKWYVGPSVFQSAPNSLYISNDSGLTNAYTINTTSVVHAYRDIQMPVTVGQISVSFDFKAGGQSATDYVRVWLVPVSFTPTPGTQITVANSGGVQVGGNFHLTPDWTTQNSVINAATYANTVRRLVFEWRNDAFTGAQPAAAIDNVNVKAVTCPAPTALTLGSATQSSATYTWTAPVGTPPAEYEYYYSQNAGAGPSATTTPSGTATATTATISPLNPSETYYMWVRSSCGTSDKSFWIGPVAVVVPQIPATLNLVQNFDLGAHGFSLNNGAQPNKWVVGSAVSNSPANSLYVTNDNGVTNGYNVSLASVVQAYRDITIPATAGEVSVTFDYKTVGEAGWDYIRVWMVPVTFVPTPGTQITAAADRIQLGGNLQTTPAWTNISFDTPVNTYQNQVRRLVFEWRNDGVFGDQPAGAIDNINVSVVTCPKPTALAATNVTNANATLDWTEPGSATSWEVAYMPALGAATPTVPGIPVTTTSEYTPPAGTFVYGTQYVFYVRSNCGAVDGLSKWAGPFAFALKPVNDDCATPIVVLTNPDLNCTNFANGGIMGATASVEPSTCGGTEDDDVWFEFVATNTSHNINLNNVTGSTTDLFHGVYSGASCGALTQLLCSDPNNSVINNLVVGQTYKIRVWSWTATAGQTSAFQVCITTPPPPPLNDPCSGAFTVPVNPTLVCTDTAPGTIYSATASPEASTCLGTEDDDIWYTFVATNTTHRISILNIVGGTTDLVHAFYSGANCGALTQMYCSDPNESWANGLVVGQTYYIRIYSWTATAGQTSAFNVCVGTPPPPPANDECAGAITAPVNPTMICEDVVNGSVQSATASPEANTCGNTADDDDVWFEFTATGPAHIVELKNITGSTTDLYHAVYTGDVCGTLTQLYCSDANYSLALNLTVGETYKVRVWTNTATLNQTSAFQLCVSTPPPPPVNDECAGAIVVPVNQNANCTLTATASVFGATASAEANTCGGNDDDDVWFEFTATHTTHLISLTNIIGSTQDLFHVLYSGDQCGTLTQLYCSDANTSVANGLIIGNLYKIRVYTNTATINQTAQFDVCVKIPNTPIVVNPNLYTTEQLVTEVLINSECALVSNITSVSGATFGDVPSIAYFDANGATFPFSYGVVLATGSAQLAQGPFVNGGNTGGNSALWVGDDELNDIIVANDPAQVNGTENATLLEFDFIPLTNKFSFDFLFASSEYGTFQCTFSDAFAFILTDPDGNAQNLAVIPDTDIPVSVTNIRDTQYNTGCGSNNVQYFGQYNLNEPMASAINYNGQTKALTAEADVIPGESYHIKLVIADYSDTAYNSAVFLGGGSFDIGELDLGGNLLVDDGTAICDTQSKLLDTELVGDNYIFTWYKNGIVIDGETGSSYEVTESGNYGVEATFENISCSYEGSVIVEFYPPVNEITGDPVNLVQCDATGFHVFDLTTNIDAILAMPSDPENFTSTIYLTEADALADTNPIDPSTYSAFTNTIEDLQTLWVKTVYSVTTCVGIKSFDLIVQDLTPVYTIDADFSICEGTSDTIDIVITDTDPNPVTYTWTKDGSPLPDTTPSITVTEAGAYTVVLDRTGCSTTSTVNVVVTPIPVADDPADVTICDSYTLPALSAGNSYFKLPEGTPLAEGDIIQSTTDIRVLAESGTTPNCTSENVFTVTINPIPLVVSPGAQAACDSFVLPALSDGDSYYTGPGATGTQLNADDVISSTQTIYVYEETGTVPNCFAEESFVVTITETPVADTPSDVNVCDSYMLPALSAGNSYYTGSGGTGTPLAAGDVISTSQPIYVYAQTGTTPNCTDEHLFNVNITPTPAFSLGGPYTSCDASNITINIANTNFNNDDATFEWTLNGNPIPASNVAIGFGTYTLTVTVNNCSHTESVEVTQDTTAIALIITDGCDGGEYLVNVADNNGSFNIDTATYAWTGPNSFTSAEREFAAPAIGEYFVTVTTPDGCVGEGSFIVTDTSCTIQKGISPNGDGKNDEFDLTTLNVKKLSIFNRYGQEVYSKKDYKKEWVGQNDSGNELPTGTYFYMVERASGESHTGWIYINRQN